MKTLSLLLVLLIPQDDETVKKRFRSGLELHVPKEWKATKPKSKLRFGQYKILDKEKKAGDAELVVYYFGRGGGGGEDANIDRWVSQFKDATREKAKIDKFKNGKGLQVVRVDLTGTFIAETFPGSGKRANRANTRMIAIIVKTPVGKHYLKLVGPADTVGDWAKAYDKLIRGAEFFPEE